MEWDEEDSGRRLRVEGEVREEVFVGRVCLVDWIARAIAGKYFHYPKTEASFEFEIPREDAGDARIAKDNGYNYFQSPCEGCGEHQLFAAWALGRIPRNAREYNLIKAREALEWLPLSGMYLEPRYLLCSRCVVRKQVEAATERGELQ